jgi:ring-1,2-phenylacetyl-CoA epoxidase subunit PaaB
MSEQARPQQAGPEQAKRERASPGQASPGEASPSKASTEQAPRSNWPLYEVFLRSKRGLNHVHVGSLHAADATMALHHARDLYTRRNEGVSIWVVRAADITASSPDEKDPFFAPSGDKVYRHPTFYEIPDSVPHI